MPANRRQVDITARHDHFVDQGVELAANRSVLFEQAGEVTVECVGDRCDHKHGECPEVKPGSR